MPPALLNFVTMLLEGPGDVRWADYKITLSTCQSVSESVTRNELNTLQITVLHRPLPNLPPGRCGYLLFLVEIRETHVCQTGSGINFYHPTHRKIALVSNGERYHDGASGSRRWNRPWAIDWHYDFWPWMNLNSPRLKSLKLRIKCLKMIGQ